MRPPGGYPLALSVLAFAVLGCGPPVNVRLVSPRTVSAELGRSALNSNRPSLFSENVLYRWNLTALYRRDPEGALAALRERAIVDDVRRPTVFALAELCFLHAERSRRRDYYLAAAVFAYAFLFPGPGSAPLDELDPRARLAADLYNRGLTAAFSAGGQRHVDLRAGLYPLPFGQQLAVYLDPTELEWANRQLYDFVPVAELQVTGLAARFRRAGIGAPLAASMRPLDPAHDGSDLLASEAKAPVTALLRIAAARAQLADPTIVGTLEVFNAHETRTVDIEGESVPLEVEPSAVLAYALSRSRVWGWEWRGFLFGDLFGQEQFKKPLAFVEPYRPGRIPVVFVHGTASSPGRWANMLNVLSNVESLRDRYQYWFFFYETGNPIAYSAMTLRETLAAVVARLDPDGADPALRQMVLIGHSQGGLLAKMAVIDSGPALWGGFSSRPLEELHVGEETRDLLRRSLFVTPLPFVSRVLFLATPHRGSYVAGWRLSRWVSSFAQLPLVVVDATADVIQGNPDAVLFNPRRPAFGSVRSMTPGSPFLETLATIPIAPGVRAHSIIPVRGALPPEGQSDGVVRFDSARLAGVETELVVPHAGHSVQSNPVAIEEVRRILVEHADDVCRASAGLHPDRETDATDEHR